MSVSVPAFATSALVSAATAAPALPEQWTYVLRQAVHHPADTVFQYLIRPETPAELQPLVIAFKVIDDQHVEYTEQLRLLGLPVWKLTVPAVKTVNSVERKLYFESTVSGTHVLHEYAVHPVTETTCEVVDSVLVEAPWLARGYVLKTARNAHQKMLDALPAGLEKHLQATGSASPASADATER